jgi:hypothetical protein
MLRNRYDRTDLFAMVPQLGLRFEPQLEQLDRLPDDTTLIKWANVIGPETVERINDRVVRSLKVTRGRELRVDTTAVETDIHFPTDSGLIGDGVRVVSRLHSLFEPHTQVIPRFKAGKPVEFGRKIRLDEVEGGIITGYSVLEKGGGQDQPHLGDSLANHVKLFGRSPRLLAADRGMSSSANEQLAKGAGIKHVALPQVGKAPPERRAEEKGPRFEGAYKFHARIEGRIHVLRRDYKLNRSRYHGERGMGRWVGWVVVAHNLSKVAEAGSIR